VFAVRSPADRVALQAYVAHLRELHPLYRFGFVDDPFRRRRARDGRLRTMVFDQAGVAARYLCRYLTESNQLASMLQAGDHSFRAIWVAPSLTQASGVSMRRLRRVRHAYWVLRAIHENRSRPTLPVWWGDLREKTEILRLLRPAALAAT
jgi:hypothetical protein